MDVNIYFLQNEGSRIKIPYAYILSEKGCKRLEKNHPGDGSICTPDKKDVSVVEG